VSRHRNQSVWRGSLRSVRLILQAAAAYKIIWFKPNQLNRKKFGLNCLKIRLEKQKKNPRYKISFYIFCVLLGYLI
jgi:hypothetical protein